MAIIRFISEDIAIFNMFLSVTINFIGTPFQFQIPILFVLDVLFSSENIAYTKSLEHVTWRKPYGLFDLIIGHPFSVSSLVCMYL